MKRKATEAPWALAFALLFSPSVFLTGCRGDQGPPPTARQTADAARPAEGPYFVDITEQSGLDFVHRGGESGDYMMPAIMRGGGAVFDADGDQDLDIYLTNSGDRLPGASESASDVSESNRFFRQNDDGTFTDATEQSGLGDRGYGMGCAVGDFDNDGDLDLYLTNFGKDRLYQNQGEGVFRDVTLEASLGDQAWSTSAVFFDYDRDGWLDLYVTRYVEFDRARVCADESGRRDFCGPTEFPGVPDLLYRNLGDGSFEDRSARAGLTVVADAGLGVAAHDFDGDGWLDLYVANDADPNQLWINGGDGAFADEAVVLGAAYNLHGLSEAGMGLSAGDADGDGDLDLFMTHLIDESNTYYQNLGELGFEDSTAGSGLGIKSLNYTGWGTSLFDFDNDGDLDVAVVNGGSKRRPAPVDGSVSGLVRDFWSDFWRDYAEPDQLFSNRGDGIFDDASSEAGDLGRRLAPGRGLIPADFDADGDLDLLVINTGGPARLLQNQVGAERSWIELAVIDPELGRIATGSTVRLETGAGSYFRTVSPAGGYQTSSEARLLVGLGDAERVEHFVVAWPDGSSEEFEGVAARRRHELRKGEGSDAP